jgi:hypothetical protein
MTWFEQIALFMKETYQPQETSKMKEEAAANVERLRKQAAGRWREICTQLEREQASLWLLRDGKLTLQKFDCPVDEVEYAFCGLELAEFIPLDAVAESGAALVHAKLPVGHISRQGRLPWY